MRTMHFIILNPRNYFSVLFPLKIMFFCETIRVSEEPKANSDTT